MGATPKRLRCAGAWVVRLGSCFHQFSPICSALSTEHTSKRMRMVNNSTLARDTRISPAITKPLSSTRSNMSIRFVVPDNVGLCMFDGLFAQICDCIRPKMLNRLELPTNQLTVETNPSVANISTLRPLQLDVNRNVTARSPGGGMRLMVGCWRKIQSCPIPSEKNAH